MPLSPGCFKIKTLMSWVLILCSSLNHALSVSHPGTTWTWLATTLNPHYEGNDLGYMINDDRYLSSNNSVHWVNNSGNEEIIISSVLSGRFIMGSLDNWFFGEDDTGDLLARENADKLVARAREVKIGHCLNSLN